MDSRSRGAVLTPRTVARILFSILVVLPFAQAHAAAKCFVADKVARDGIVSMPLPTGAPQTPELSLISLGTVRDSQQQIRPSVWRIANAGSADARVTIQVADVDYHIPVLARAGKETYVRSNWIEGLAPHRLLVDDTVVATASLIQAPYVDERELQGSECPFEGNPLYVAERAGALKISTIHAAPATQWRAASTSSC